MKRARSLAILGIGCLAMATLSGCFLFNQPPVASFTATPVTGPAPLTVVFDASDSSDPNHDVLTYDWDFDDGGSGNVVSGFHVFTTPGEYEVELTVTDSHGVTSSMTRAILVTAPENEAPTAGFSASPTTGPAPLIVTFNASASTDPDGTIASYQWSFGDGGTATGKNVFHTFAAQGAYVVQLTVADDDGATDVATAAILVTEPGNQLPVPSFTADPTSGFFPFDVDFDASASYDPDGSIIAYQWDFGDGDSGSGATVTHTYDAFGTYTAVLTVIDNNGAPASDAVEINSWINIGPIGPIFVPYFPLFP